MFYKIVETDNFGGDYPDEKFVSLPPMTKEKAEAIADVINQHLSGNHADRYWKVVDSDYTLSPGFEP